MIDLSVPNRSLTWNFVSFALVATLAMLASVFLFSILVAPSEPNELNLL